MNKIAFVTDSGTGLSAQEWLKEGIYSVPLQIAFDNSNFKEFEDFGFEEIIDVLKTGKAPATSLPAMADIERLFRKLKDNGVTEVFAIPICSGLSSTISAMYAAATSLDLEFNAFDCGTTARIQAELIRYAKRLYEQGFYWNEIIKKLNLLVQSANTILIPDDLRHLSKGGRLSITSAILGSMIKIKPILEVNLNSKGKIEAVHKVRTFKRAIRYVIDEMMTSLKDSSESYKIVIAHVDAHETAENVKTMMQTHFPLAAIELIPLVPSVSAHTGLGCIAIQYFKNTDLL